MVKITSNSQKQPITFEFKTASKVTKEELQTRILYWFNTSVLNLKQSQWKALARNWYPACQDFLATAVADRRGLDREQVIGIFAILSATKDIGENLDLMFKCLEFEHRLRATDDNWKKACNLRDGGDIYDNVRGQKVVAFFHNIMGDTESITLDRHMGDALGICNITDKRSDTCNLKIYQAFKELEQQTLLAPSELQNLVWIKYRSKSEGRLMTDLEYFDY